jgi:hypothetical protein
MFVLLCVLTYVCGFVSAGGTAARLERAGALAAGRRAGLQLPLAAVEPGKRRASNNSRRHDSLVGIDNNKQYQNNNKII